MPTLITGGNGFIGWRVAQRLLARGETVLSLDIAPPNAHTMALAQRHGDRLRLEQGDVGGAGRLGELIKRHRVTRILHLAFVLGAVNDTDPGLATQVNLAGTTTILDLARLLDVEKVVLASSIAVYGADSRYRATELPLDEDAPCHLARPALYGAGKVYLEALAGHYRAEFGLDTVCLRPSVVYGPGRRSGSTGHVVALIEDAAGGRPVHVRNGDAALNLIYVEDVADQFTALLHTPTRRTVFNSGGDACTMRELADTVRAVLPDAVITVEPGTETAVSGLPASVSGAAIDAALGPTRRHSPLIKGVRAIVDTTRRAG